MTEPNDIVEEVVESEEIPTGDYVTETEVGQIGSAEEESAPREPIVIDRPIQTVGRRKEAVVRVRLVPGTGKWSINGHPLEEYFPNKVHQQSINEPFVTAGVVDSYDVIARINGGGVTGQAGALRLGIARALNAIDTEASRPALKKAGLLTRDARIKERKKAGLKKARKAPQYSKR